MKNQVKLCYLTFLAFLFEFARRHFLRICCLEMLTDYDKMKGQVNYDKVNGQVTYDKVSGQGNYDEVSGQVNNDEVSG